MNNTAILLREEHLSELPSRPSDGHKGTFGRVLIVAGSVGMCGASYLCAMASYRTGAGIVHMFIPEENRTIIQCLIPEAIVSTYTDSSDFTNQLNSLVKMADSVVFGPGFGKRQDAKIYLKAICKINKPMIIDADGLNLLADNPKYINKLPYNTVLTPHIGEFARLSGIDPRYIKANVSMLAELYAKSHKVVIVLKNHETYIGGPEGQLYYNNYGNSGMGTAGSGDVLAGIIGALLALKEVTPSMAGALGVLMHAIAGDAAASKYSERYIMARDIIDNIR